MRVRISSGDFLPRDGKLCCWDGLEEALDNICLLLIQQEFKPDVGVNQVFHPFHQSSDFF